MRIGHWAVAGLLLAAWAGNLVQAQPPLPFALDPAVKKPTEPEVKREQIAEQLRLAQRILEATKQTDVAKPPTDLSREVELLKQIDVTLAQQQAAQTALQEATQRHREALAQIETTSVGGTGGQTLSFPQLDQMRDQLRAMEERAPTLEAAALAAADAIAMAKTQVDAKQQVLSMAKFAGDSNRDEARTSELVIAAKLAELESKLATETLSLRQLEAEKERLRQGQHAAEMDLTKLQIKLYEHRIPFTSEDLQNQLTELDRQEAELQRSLEAAQSNLAYAESQWSSARERLDATLEPPAALTEEVAAKRQTRQFRQAQIAACNQQIQRVAKMRPAWEQRFQVLNQQAATEELLQWRQDVQDCLEQLQREQRIEKLRADDLRQDLANLENKLQMADADTARWVRDQQATLQKLIQVSDRNIASIEATARLYEKLQMEIQGEEQNWSLEEWVSEAWHYTRQAWNTEVLSVDARPITVGKIIVGALLLAMSFYLSKKLSRTFGAYLLGRFGVNESGAAALVSVSFYVLLALFSLTALRFVNVPLTVFTFLGGAVAIGVGFGSQNIVNNFISGLILLAERPIRVGDLIQVDDLHGIVEQIGARSTRLRTGTNMEIIVPNSRFLESNVFNLTLGDNRIRTSVQIGIAYGSPTREAARLLKHAAQEHGLIQSNPEPFVWFTGFGDNALNFELFFWVAIRNIAEMKRVESDIRFKIDQLFREAGISMAFPQRDVHLDVTKPLAVRFLSAGDASGDAFTDPSSHAA